MLISIEDIGDGVKLGLWSFVPDKKLPPRDMERLAVRSLLTSIFGHSDFEIGHFPSGKPYVAGYNISISHTRGFVAVMLSDKYAVGVDIEYRSDRINRIASRFMRADEEADNTERRLVNWCAKEAVYKLFSEDNLAYHQMRVYIGFDGDAVVENMKRKASVRVCYRVLPEYVLVYCFGNMDDVSREPL